MDTLTNLDALEAINLTLKEARNVSKNPIFKGSSTFHVEIYYERSESTTIDIRDQKVDALKKSRDEGVSIRTLVDGKLGFSYSFDLSKGALIETLHRALEVGKFFTPDAYQTLGTKLLQKEFEYTSIADHAGFKVSLEEKIAIARNIEKSALLASPLIKRVRKSGFDETFYEIALFGLEHDPLVTHGTVYTAYCTCIAENTQGQAEVGSDAQYSTCLKKLDYSSVGKTSAVKAIQLLGASKIHTQNVPAVFVNNVVADILGFLVSSFSSENIDKNFSMLKGKLGEKIFSEVLTLTDDPHFPDGISSIPFDGEGSPTKKTVLIKNGKVENFLFDLYYAKKQGVASTGSSRRGSLKSQPSISCSNLILTTGNNSFDNLLEKAENGILITHLLGLHTANPITGEFSVGASGVTIKNGKLDQPVKGFAIAGNLLTLLSNVSDVGSDSRFFGAISSPSILIRELAIGGNEHKEGAR